MRACEPSGRVSKRAAAWLASAASLADRIECTERNGCRETAIPIRRRDYANLRMGAAIDARWIAFVHPIGSLNAHALSMRINRNQQGMRRFPRLGRIKSAPEQHQ
jgi:hypothetical protein